MLFHLTIASERNTNPIVLFNSLSCISNKKPFIFLTNTVTYGTTNRQLLLYLF